MLLAGHCLKVKSHSLVLTEFCLYTKILRNVLRKSTYGNCECGILHFKVSLLYQVCVILFVILVGKTDNHAVVMARLYTKGEYHGIYPFLVQLRSMDDHKTLPGNIGAWM